MAVTETGIQIAGFPLLHDNRNGYSIETDMHTYELYELVSLGGSTTSDILMVMVDDWNRTQNDDEVPTSIGWVYGASNFPNDKYALANIEEYILNYEGR